MTSPTTHEEKKPLSPEELLKPLRLRAATLRREVTTARESIATYEQYKTEGAVQWASERIAGMNEAIRQREPELTATEHAIAILETLNHPDFGAVQRIHREAWCESMRTSQCFCFVRSGPMAHGHTIVEALLSVHKAVQEHQTQADPEP